MTSQRLENKALEGALATRFIRAIQKYFPKVDNSEAQILIKLYNKSIRRQSQYLYSQKNLARD
jgi:hypothetical protein